MASLVEPNTTEMWFPLLTFPEGAVLRMRGHYGFGPLHLFSRADVPDVALLESRHKALPEFIMIDARWTVSAEVKALIESLEPGRHQFFAVTIKREKGNQPILRRDGTVLDTPYYLFNSTERLDAVLIERSVVEIHAYKGQPTLVQVLPQNRAKTVLRHDVMDPSGASAGRR